MQPVERLRREHALLRAKLQILESALALHPQAWYVARELVYTLARQLKDHIRREESLISRCRASLEPDEIAHLGVTHRREPRLLSAINRAFVQGPGEARAAIRPRLLALIERLRRHMDEEEAMLFPELERRLPSEEEFGEPSVEAGVDERMTVNRVLRAYPEAAGVFRRMFINIQDEGLVCLDEVAWRHGIDCRTLIRELEGDIAGERTAGAEFRVRV
ncbi:MAG TPA: hemerythrin domain-containing protein [bacterium]